MIAISVKTTRRRAAAAVCAFVLAVGALLALPLLHTGGRGESAAAGAFGGEVKSAGDIRRFLAGFGWETAERPEETAEVLIPERFDEVLTRYNAIQKAQGADLTPYAGRTVTRYTFAVTNFTSADGTPEADVRANVLVCDGRVIGGDVCSLRLDGFMQGLVRPGGKGERAGN